MDDAESHAADTRNQEVPLGPLGLADYNLATPVTHYGTSISNPWGFDRMKQFTIFTLQSCLAAVVWASQVALLSASTGPDKPNIVFILADDLGFNQLGCYGNTPIQTPNLDRLANAGIRFTQAYAGNTVCSPSRVSLFTGRDGRLMENNSNKVQLRDIDVTIAHVLKHASYDTALFGKYSIGSQMGVTDPLAMGFDTWYGMYSILEGHRQYPHILWRDGKKLRIASNEGGKRGAYAQALFANEAIDYIGKPHDNPFFVLLAFSSPHAELAAPTRYVKQYENQFHDSPYTGMSTGTASDKYAWYYPHPVEKPHATFAGMVTALDDYVGRIVTC